MLQNSKPEKAVHPRKKAIFLNQKSSPCQFGGFATPSPGIIYDLFTNFKVLHQYVSSIRK